MTETPRELKPALNQEYMTNTDQKITTLIVDNKIKDLLVLEPNWDKTMYIAVPICCYLAPPPRGNSTLNLTGVHTKQPATISPTPDSMNPEQASTLFRITQRW
ncbi:hypothetical protein K7432_011787 [Basidiobolus ranarum]|uniref:Uncharacterized protein n=1 Tax=Basidiobolus ranarum TaxID=34480 RepID=A0ABR2WLT6_9FUNG